MQTVFKEDPIKELCKALSLTDDPTDIENFLNSLLTSSELKAVSDRWALVRLIDSGMSQRKVADNLGLSLCKITRGSKELKKDESPFRKMIDRYLG
ncbi:Trp family transcriptional regulator [Spirochaeta cellobiosiphila]|uniref:Trp family transcriptional regulator n=1 Tax=Spirochaeta cellobiosiphila TaxID=504483 RepID=UPI0003F9108E|nr:Trp family transcriptional regulator [Spirochaeta cellobiosiphila]